MMTVDQMNAIKGELRITYQELSKESGVPLGTLQKVLGGFTKDPRASTLHSIEDALCRMKRNRELARGTFTSEKRDIQVVRDGGNYYAPFSYGSETEKADDTAQNGDDERLRTYRQRIIMPEDGNPHIYTVEEREQLPDDRRTELINGVLYDMATPTTYHQMISQYVYMRLYECIVKHGMLCHAFMAPLDVQIDRDAYTMVQPDVFVVCDESQITPGNVQGPPAFILEVLSPSTRRKDQIDKLAKYSEAGVSEYWIIDPTKREIVVYDMRDKAYEDGCDDTSTEDMREGYEVSVYHFTDRIPVLISENRCVIDMAPIKSELDRLYGENWGRPASDN